MEKIEEKAREKIRKQASNVFAKVMDKVLVGNFDVIYLRVAKLYEMLQVFEDTTLKEENK